VPHVHDLTHPGRRVVELECLSADGYPILVAVDHLNRARLWAVLLDITVLEETKAALYHGLEMLDAAERRKLRVI
jgi:hypothetical protein